MYRLKESAFSAIFEKNYGSTRNEEDSLVLHDMMYYSVIILYSMTLLFLSFASPVKRNPDKIMLVILLKLRIYL